MKSVSGKVIRGAIYFRRNTTHQEADSKGLYHQEDTHTKTLRLLRMHLTTVTYSDNSGYDDVIQTSQRIVVEENLWPNGKAILVGTSSTDSGASGSRTMVQCGHDPFSNRRGVLPA